MRSRSRQMLWFGAGILVGYAAAFAEEIIMLLARRPAAVDAGGGTPGDTGEDDAAHARHARFGALPATARPEDWVEETDTDPPAHELEQSITVVQHPGRTYET